MAIVDDRVAHQVAYEMSWLHVESSAYRLSRDPRDLPTRNARLERHHVEREPGVAFLSPGSGCHGRRARYQGSARLCGILRAVWSSMQLFHLAFGGIARVEGGHQRWKQIMTLGDLEWAVSGETRCQTVGLRGLSCGHTLCLDARDQDEQDI